LVAETVLTEAWGEQAGHPGQPQAPPVDAAQQSLGHAQQQTQPRATNEPANRLEIEDNMTISFKTPTTAATSAVSAGPPEKSSSSADPNGHTVGSDSERWLAES